MAKRKSRKNGKAKRRTRKRKRQLDEARERKSIRRQVEAVEATAREKGLLKKKVEELFNALYRALNGTTKLITIVDRFESLLEYIAKHFQDP